MARRRTKWAVARMATGDDAKEIRVRTDKDALDRTDGDVEKTDTSAGDEQTGGSTQTNNNNNGTTSSSSGAAAPASPRRRMSFSSQDIIALEMQMRKQKSFETERKSSISATPSRSSSFKGSDTSEKCPSLGRVSAPPSLVSKRVTNPGLHHMLNERRRFG